MQQFGRYHCYGLIFFILMLIIMIPIIISAKNSVEVNNATKIKETKTKKFPDRSLKTKEAKTSVEVSNAAKRKETKPNRLLPSKSFKPKEQGNKDQEISVPGIKNLGNTCFINSSLQTLLNEPKVQDMFHDKKHSERCDKKHSESSSDSTFCFSCDFEKLCEKNQKNETLVPTKLYENQQALGIPEFNPGEQQDAARFLLNFMEKLRLENRCGRKTPFEHDFQTETKCLHCENCSIVQHKSQTNLYNIKPNETIEAALKERALGETPEYPGSYVECLQCGPNSKKPYWKNEVIATPPEVLVLQIERIQYSVTLGIWKDMTPVQLTKDIDISPLFSESQRTTNEIYDLKGVIVHLGEAGYGHWIAFVKDQHGWLKCNDSKVTRVSESKVLDEKQANILVYRKSQPMLKGS